MKTIRGLQVLSLSLCCVSVVAAQQGEQAKESSESIWIAYIGEHPISHRWNLHLEGQVFWSLAPNTTELVFARPGLRRTFSHGLSALMTYAYFAKDPAITNASQTLGEHRLSEDLQWTHPLLDVGAKRMTLTHRWRAEQRYEALDGRSHSSDAWRYAERARYRLTGNIPLPGHRTGPGPDYVSAYDEVFVNFGPHRSKQALDQNIVAGAVGWNVTSTLQIEAGYLLEYNPSPVGLLGTYNHVAQINLVSTVPLSRRPSR